MQFHWPHFPTSRRGRIFAALVLALQTLSLLAVAVVAEPVYIFPLAAAHVLITVCAIYPAMPIIGMAATFPFIQLEFVYGAVNAPVVDIIALMALAGAALRFCWMVVNAPHELRLLRLPAWIPFTAFIVVALLATTHAPDQWASLSYVLRPMIFFYVMFVTLPVNALVNKKILHEVLWTMCFVGVAIAIYGLLGLVVNHTPSLLSRRVTPFPLFGYYPLGTNHNPIADAMVATVPVAFYLWSRVQTVLAKKWMLLIMLLLIGTAMLTFSRSAWLALSFEAVVVIALQYRAHLRRIMRYVAVIVLVLSPLLVYMVYFSSQDFVESSNENRLLLADIAQEMFVEYPLLGAGPGTFVTYVEHNRLYMQEYGAVLDAHSLIYKVAGELGILGILTFGALLGTVLWILYRQYAHLRHNTEWSLLLLCMLMMVSGEIFFQLFQTSYYVARLWFPIGVALSAAVLSQRLTQRNERYE